MRFTPLAALALLLSGCGSPDVAPPALAAPSAQTSDPTRFEAAIEQFEETDRQRPVVPGTVVFVGSSSIRMWDDLSADFPGISVLNRGFGGSELDDVLHYLDRVVIRYAPPLVMVYAGENDLNSGKSPERVLEDFRTLVARVHSELPETRIGFISIKPSPSRWHLESRMRATNALVREYTDSDARLSFVDVFNPMLGADGTPRRELFIEDMLHMNEQGYRIWRAAISPLL